MIQFFAKLRGVDDTHVYLGELVGAGANRRQKGVDILLTVEALKVARSINADVIALVAGDRDFVPLVKAIRDEGLMVIVVAFADSVSPG